MRKKQKKTRRQLITLVVAAALVVFAVFALRTVQPDVERLLYPKKYSRIVSEQAKAYALEENLVYAVIRAESNFDPAAVSPVGARGLMQLMPETFEWMQTHVGGEYDEDALFDPAVNIRFGCALLRLLLNEYGDLSVALCAYNAGIGNVTSWLSDGAYSEDGITLQVIPFEETRLYVQKVLQYKEIYEELYGGIGNG